MHTISPTRLETALLWEVHADDGLQCHVDPTRRKVVVVAREEWHVIDAKTGRRTTRVARPKRSIAAVAVGGRGLVWDEGSAIVVEFPDLHFSLERQRTGEMQGEFLGVALARHRLVSVDDDCRRIRVFEGSALVDEAEIPDSQEYSAAVHTDATGVAPSAAGRVRHGGGGPPGLAGRVDPRGARGKVVLAPRPRSRVAPRLTVFVAETLETAWTPWPIERPNLPVQRRCDELACQSSTFRALLPWPYALWQKAQVVGHQSE